jgi:hypothetical protein
MAEIFTGQDQATLEAKSRGEGHEQIDHGMRSLMDDLGISMDVLLESSIFVPSPLHPLHPLHPLPSPTSPLTLHHSLLTSHQAFAGLANLDWRGREICFCTGVVEVGSDGE